MTTETNEYVPAPEQRFTMPELSPEWYRAMIGLDAASRPLVDPVIGELVRMLASSINGCAYCLDMHATDARKAGEQEHRLYALRAWRDTPYFTAKERAALALTEAVTRISDGHVPDEVYEEAAKQFAPNELSQLLGVIISINSWNRISITSRMSPAPKQN